MQGLLDSVQSAAGLISVIGLVIAVVALVVAWRAFGGSGAVAELPPPSQTLVDDPALDRVLTAQLQRMDAMANDVQRLAARMTAVEAASRLAIQSAGLMRFNPFREDTGGNLSFALALLDAEKNGVVLSSLHSRQNTRVYIKAITAGQADQALSEEETAALRQAMGGSPAPA